MRAAWLPALLLAACGQKPAEPPRVPGGAGPALEQAARAAGMIADPDRVVPTGVYASDTDRVCVLPAGDGYRIGASVDYGEGQRCTARGTARGQGRLDVQFGGTCRFTAQVDDARIVFPAILPGACDRACSGRASLAALSAARLSDAAAEAARAEAADGAALCGG